MAGEINGFNFSQYDVGGNGATANDGKLTGDEVQKARNAGFNVWEGMTSNIVPGRIEEIFDGVNVGEILARGRKAIGNKPMMPQTTYNPETGLITDYDGTTLKPGRDAGFYPLPPTWDELNDETPKYYVDKSNDKNFIPVDSDLGKQIGRTTLEYRPDIDKYQPVYGEPYVLGRREIIGYVEPNLWDLFE